MVVPPRPSSSFVVVQPKFALQILIGPFRSPSLHDQTDSLDSRPHRLAYQEMVCWLFFSFSPLNQKRHCFALVSGFLASSKAGTTRLIAKRAQWLLGSFSPGRPPNPFSARMFSANSFTEMALGDRFPAVETTQTVVCGSTPTP
jgi:hypothetical protein